MEPIHDLLPVNPETPSYPEKKRLSTEQKEIDQISQQILLPAKEPVTGHNKISPLKPVKHKKDNPKQSSKPRTKSCHTSTLPILEQKKTEEILLENTQKLLQKDIKTSEVRHLLLFWNEGIIKSEELFSSILLQMKKDPQLNYTFYLMFCINWVRYNSNTHLIKKAGKEITAIIEFTKEIDKEHSDILNHLIQNPNDTEYRKGLLSLEEKHEQDVDPLKLLEQSKSEHPSDFLTLIGSILSNEIKHTQYQKIVNQISDDLLHHQLSNYFKCSQNDFIKEKWEKTNENISLNSKYQALISNFIIDKILLEKELEKRARLIEFFLDVFNNCLEKNDYESTMIISLSLTHSLVRKLTKTWAIVSENNYDSIITKMLNISSPWENYKHLHSKIKECKEKNQPFIPFLCICLKDIEPIRECPSLQGDGAYNINKIKNLKTVIDNYLYAGV